MKTILIAGGSGLVGNRLTTRLLEQGHQVKWLSRKSVHKDFPVYQWDIQNGDIQEGAFEGVDVVINLAGAGIADQKWTRNRKKVLIDSRTLSVATLDKYIQSLGRPIETFINASAIGFYGDQQDRWCIESDNPGNGFLAECCTAWENAVGQMSSTCPKAIVRIGIVLSTLGGALEKMLLPLKFRTNTYFGNGKQYMSWIHIDDLCRIIELLVSNPQNGIFNAVTDNPQPNKSFAKQVAEGRGTSAILVPAPAFGLRLAMGEMADVVLESTRVQNDKIKKLGYSFQFDDVADCVQDLSQRKI